jgi:hypothetical protein
VTVPCSRVFLELASRFETLSYFLSVKKTFEGVVRGLLRAALDGAVLLVSPGIISLACHCGPSYLVKGLIFVSFCDADLYTGR